MAVSAADNSRLQFLWNASHALFGKAPNASAYYMSRFQRHVEGTGVKVATTVQQHYCQYCGMVLVPAVTCQVHIAGKKRKRSTSTVSASEVRGDTGLAVAEGPKRTMIVSQESNEVPAPENRSRRKQKRTILLCDACMTANMFPTEHPAAAQEVPVASKQVSQSISATTSSNLSRPISSNSTKSATSSPSTPSSSMATANTGAPVKKKKKNKNKMSLQNLLRKDRSIESPSSGLKLEDFLSSI
ncbi:hypothetical protein BZG36_00945 [Bifiguratus adelaidae]|uniref:Uncharacterized protein n=1 Tax=Bifiguratus adelaidae TaxID=1938954 RepID=A0A261Y5B3_9FUNG|nr:hypothetical protein BZG36_00945 [Bifiguratus adelaidae]